MASSGLCHPLHIALHLHAGCLMVIQQLLPFQTSPRSKQEERVTLVGSVPYSHWPKLCHLAMASFRDTRKAEDIVMPPPPQKKPRKSVFLEVFIIVVFSVTLSVTLAVSVTYCLNDAV